MQKILILAALIAAPALAEEPLGPSGLPSEAPFKLVAQYSDDYAASTRCQLAPKQGGVVSEGKLAVYYKPPSGEVEILLDEYARRFALDYCWR